MDKDLGNLGFWLAVGMVIAAMIVSGAIKERDKARQGQATLPEQRATREETLRALLERGGEDTAEILAYLRERDAAHWARAEVMQAQMERAKKISERRGLAFVGAFMVGTFSFIGGLFASQILNHPFVPRFEYSPQAGRMIPLPPPPPPTGWEAFLPLGVMLGVWAAGLIIAVLIVAWGNGKRKNDAQPDA
jgi:hypothetical protein